MGEVDLVVVLSHIGVEDDRRLAAEVEGIDLIVGGHSHTFLEAEQVGGTWIVQAGEYSKVLGVTELIVQDGEITRFSDRLVPLRADSAPGEASPEVLDLVELYDGHIRETFDAPLGTATAPMTRIYGGQSTLGSWATGMLKETTGADLAIYNSGGLRGDIPEGTVTRRTLYQVFPFGNQVVTFEISGEELTALLLSNCFRELEGRSWLQMGGVEVIWRVRLDSPELVKATVNGQPLDPGATYTVATNSFVLDQAPRMLPMLTPSNVQELDFTVLDSAVWAVERGPISPGDTDNYVRR